MTVHPYSARSRQRGAVLLLAVLFLVIGSSFMLLQGLNASAGALRAYRQQYDAEVLAHAKAALLGYAAAYPELVSNAPPDKGPGYLPCPDNPGDDFASGDPTSIDAAKEGVPATNCGGTGLKLGRYPWRYLGTERLRDASGERLWYAVSDNFRYNSAPPRLNSQTAGTLCVDANGDGACVGTDITDIVAVILAPGQVIGGQTRSAIPNQQDYSDVRSYLEDNNNTLAHDPFLARPAGDLNGDGQVDYLDLNDQVAYITRAELMAVVEKRVLGDVRTWLTRYFADPDYDDGGIGNPDPDCTVVVPDCDDGFPWLSTWGNPATTAFKGQPAFREGQLPFHYSADTPTTLPAPANPRNPFRTAFSMSWDINNATLDITAAGRHPQAPLMPSCDPPTNACNDVLVRPPDACATDSDCDGSPLGVLQGTCIWSNVANPRDNMNCTASIDLPPTTEIIVVGGLPVVGTRERNYTFTFTFDDNVDDDGDGIPEAEVVAATGGASRVRNLNHDNTDPFAPPTSAATITVTDTFTDNSGVLAPMVGWVTLTNDGDTVADSIDADGIQYDLDGDGRDLDGNNDFTGASEVPPDLPEWFFANNWTHLILVSYSDRDAPGATPRPPLCDTTGTCLILTNSNPVPTNDKRGVAVMAGPPLGGLPRPSGNESDYFEKENDQAMTPNLPNPIFERQLRSTTFNDQVTVLGTAP